MSSGIVSSVPSTTDQFVTLTLGCYYDADGPIRWLISATRNDEGEIEPVYTTEIHMVVPKDSYVRLPITEFFLPQENGSIGDTLSGWTTEPRKSTRDAETLYYGIMATEDITLYPISQDIN